LPPRLELRGTLPLVVRELQADVVALHLRVGHVVAVLAHAPGEHQRLPEVVACFAAGVAAAGGGGGGLVGAAEAGHPIAVVAAAAGRPAKRQGQHRADQPGQVRPAPAPPPAPAAAWWACRACPAAVLVHGTLPSGCCRRPPGRAAPRGAFGCRSPRSPTRLPGGG